MGRLLLALGLLHATAGEALAQEPLFLRIRPADAAGGTGAGGATSDAEIARLAWAARQEVWARSDRRARIAIASVCTGCLGPEPTETGSIPDAPLFTSLAPNR